MTANAIYSLGHGLHTFTAVPRLTRPSTLRERVNCVPVSGSIIITMAIVDVDGSSLTADSQPKLFGLV